MLAIVGFILMIVLMIVLIKSWVSPPVAFIGLPILAALAAGFGFSEIGSFIGVGMKSMLSTAVLFVFSISYFTLMDEIGLFDPIIHALTKKAGKSIPMILLAVLMTIYVAHLDGSGATTFLIVVPAFLPIFKRLGLRPQALLALICGPYAVMNILPWGGPTMRAATVAGVETGDLYAFIIPGVVVIALCSFLIAILVYLLEKKNVVRQTVDGETAAAEADKKKHTWRYWFNLALTLVMLVFLFLDTPMPLYSVFMIAYAIALVVNFPNVKVQNQKNQRTGTECYGYDRDIVLRGYFHGCHL